MPKFSIITVCLNSEKTIQRCLESISKQSFRDFEHIVIDGMSKDKTLDIISSYNVNLCVSEKDKGIYDAMNKGVSLSTGKYILFLNSDDEILPRFLEECNKVIGSADYLSSAINMVFKDRCSIWTAKEIARTSFYWRMPIPHAGLIVKKNVFEELGGFDLTFKVTSDFDFVIKMLKKRYIGVYNNQSYFNFYIGGISQSYKGIKENHKVRVKHFNNYGLIYLAFLLDNLRFIKSKIR
ncbi:MAG: hypothetical protein RIT11_549 [Pseudomonadota bacterium]|jgi:glycosyltransferase involved in cell wall biosynthesis